MEGEQGLAMPRMKLRLNRINLLARRQFVNRIEKKSLIVADQPNTLATPPAGPFPDA